MRIISQRRRIQALGNTSSSIGQNARPSVMRGRLALAVAAASSLLSSQLALATSDTWDGSVGNTWATSGNWASDPATVPGAGETATFSLSAAAVNNNTTIDLGAGVTLGSLIFDTSNAAAYTIGAGAAGSQTLTLDTVGNAIILNSAVANNQLFNANIALFNASTLATFTIGNYSPTALLTFAGGFTSSNLGIKVVRTDGDGQTQISGAMTAGAGSLNLLKTGNGTLILSGGGAFNGNGVQGNPSGNFPVVLRSGVTKITGGTYNVTGEMVVGGVLTHGDAGNNSLLQIDDGTLAVSSWFSLGRGNGTGGVSNDLVLNNNGVLTCGNFSGGFNGGNTLNTPKGSITMNGASRIVDAGAFYLAESPGSNYTFTMNGASSLTVNGQFRVAGTSGAGTFIMNDNATGFAGSFVVGRGDNNTQTAAGTAIFNAGTSFRSEGDLTLGFAGNNNLGYMAINGATVNVASTTERWMIIEQWDTARGQLDMNSGTLNLNANTDMRFFIGNTGTSGSGTINQNGGAITFYAGNGTNISGTGGVIDMARSGSATAVSEYNLNGGTLTVGQILSTTTLPTRRFNFNGGVIKPTGANPSWINLGAGNASLNVMAGGAKIDTNGFNVTIGQPLLDGGGGGGLTKSGLGALTITGSNTYTGATVINGGRLVLNGTIASTSGMTIGSGAELDLRNSAAATLTLPTLTLNSSILDLEFVNGVNDRIDVGGAIGKTGTTTINLTNSAGALSAGTYTLLTGASGLGSGFVLGSVPAGFFTFDLSASTATAEILTVVGNPTPAVAYWTGLASSGVDASNNWGFGSTATKSNWSTTANGLSDPLQTPGTSTDVIMAATNATGVAGALNTKLDASYSIKSLTVDVPASTGITSVGIDSTGRSLSVDGGGITVASTSNAGLSITGTGSVVVNGSQTWANNSALPMAVNTGVSAQSGATTLTIGGSGSGDVSVGGVNDGGGVVTLVVNKPTGATNLGGVSSFSGGATISAGTLNVSGSVTTPGAFNVGGEGGTGVMNISAGASVTVNNLINVGYRTGTGTLNMTGGTLTSNNDVRIGASDLNGATFISSGVANISGGVASLSSVTVGRGNFLDNNVSGTLNISGGAVTSANDVILGYAGTGGGTMTLSGNAVFNVGSTAAKWMMLGYWDQTKGSLNISGGSLNLNYGSSLVFSRQATVGASVINQTGGWVSTYSDNATTVGGTGGIDMQYVGSASSSSTYNLDGGTLTIFRIFSSASTGSRVFNFNGGTLRPAMSDAAFMNLGSGSATVNVRNGGAKIDTNGFNVTIGSPLSHSNIVGDAAIDGGLTKSGAGALVLSANATYTGPTIVQAGTLTINKTNSGGGAITVASGAGLTLNSVTATGSLAASSMTLTDSILSFNLGAVFPTAPLYNVSGGLQRSGSNVINVSGLVSTGTVTLIQYAGGETGAGSFSLGTLPTRTTATLYDLGAGKVDINFVSDIPRWTGLGDGSWTTAVQTPKNWATLATATPTDYIEGDGVRFDDTATGTTTVNMPASVSPAGVAVANSSLSYTFAGPGGITGAASLIKTGTGTLYITNTGTNSYSGGTSIGAGGTVEFAGPAVSNTNIQFLGSGSIVNDGVIHFNRAPANNWEFATVFLWNNISGAGSILVSQNGQLGGANTFDGSVTVKSGATLFLDSSGALGSSVGGTVVEDGGRIAMYPSMNLGNEAITISGNGPSYTDQNTQASYSTNGAIYSGGNSVIGGTLTLAGSAAINVGGSSLTLNGAIQGGGNDLTKNGGGRLIIAAPATYGSTFITGGRLQIGNGGTLGNLGTGNVNINGGGVDFRRTDTYTVGNFLTGSGGAVYNLGTGTVILTNSSSDIFASFGANAGTLILQGAAFATAIQVDANGTVRLANDNYSTLLSIASINSNNAETGAMELSNGVSNPFNGIDLGFAGRTNASSGLRSVNGTNTLNSNILLNTGGNQYTIEAASGGSFNVTGGISGNGTLAGGARTVIFTGDGVGTMSGVISNGGAGTLSVAKTGTGTWTLNNSNSYNGSTIANGGTLVLVGAAKSPVLTGAGGDVRSGRLVLDYADDATVPAQVLAALDAGYDQSPRFSSGKLFTTNAAASGTGLGWKNDAPSQRVTIAYTYYGDTNLDGQVDITDLAALATAWQTAGVWVNGDFNYDGLIDITDLAALATNWQQGVGAPLAMSFDQALASVGLGGVSVPEPATLGLVGLCLAGAGLRRRARRSVN